MSKVIQAVEFSTYQLSDREWVTTVNLRHYRDVEGFDARFDGVMSEALDFLERQRHDARSHFLIASVEGHRVGCIFLSADARETGRVRLFYLDDTHRGTGIARRMLDKVIECASIAGFSKLHVSTFDRHRAACRLYASCGFQSTVHPLTSTFGQTMRQVDFSLDLPI